MYRLLYLKTKDRLGLYTSTQFKKGSDMTKCLLEEKLVKPELPTLEDNHISHDKRVWEYRMGELMKTEIILEGNLCNLFMVLMSLCDSDSKNQVESMNEFLDLEKKMDSMGLLNLLKRLVYTSGAKDLNTRHNKAIVHLNLMNLHQDRFQSIQDFRYQYLAMKKVYDVLELCIERYESDVRAVLKKKNVTNSMEAQLKKAMDKLKEDVQGRQTEIWQITRTDGK